MKLGTKISLGFTLILAMALGLGIMAIVQMHRVEEQSVMLDEEYVPEVKIAGDLRGAVNRVMYAMRGYGLSGEEHFRKSAIEEIKLVKTHIGEAKDLEKTAKNLKALKGQIEISEKALSDYEQLMDQTVEINKDMNEDRKALDENAAI